MDNKHFMSSDPAANKVSRTVDQSKKIHIYW